MTATGGDTIYALASGAPPAAISIVRVSGPSAADTLRTLAGRMPEPRRATLALLRDRAGEPLDRALLLWFPGPASATGEDVAELHLHGGRAVVRAVLAALALLPGLRAAQAGEFTRRAFENGVIDLAQAAALGDLLAAETEQQRRRAIGGSDAALDRLLDGWRAELLGIEAEIEAELDFGGEDDVATRQRDPRPRLRDLASRMRDWRGSLPMDRVGEGPSVVIAGPPNSGKSSLLNALARRDAAITSPIAGTTRDRIEMSVSLDGVPVTLVDTAGLRETGDEIERMGVSRAHDAIARADLLLWLGEPQDVPCCRRSLILHARSDIPERLVSPAGAQFAVSIHEPASIEAVRRLILDETREMLTPATSMTIHAMWQDRIGRGAFLLERAVDAPALECMAEDVHAASAKLDLLEAARDDQVLDTVFRRFCIGK